MIELLESGSAPPEVTDKINELIEAHNALFTSISPAMQRRMGVRREPTEPVVEPEE